MARIGIDVTAAITQGGGIGRYTRELVRALVEIDAQHRYHFFSARPPASIPVQDPVPAAAHTQYHPAPLSERWLYRLWYRLRLPLPVQWVTGPLDLFHSPDFVLPPVSEGTPTLLTVHDLSFIHFPQAYPAVLVDYLNKVVPWSIGRATHILADSEATRQDLVALWQVPTHKITVLYSGVNSAFRPVQDKERIAAVKRQYELGSEPYLLSVGTLQPRKNYRMLIRAFASLAESQPHSLVIAGGRGWLYDELGIEVEAQGLNGRVHFPGFVDDADLPALYSGADLFVFPSWYEGFGLPLLEAMACGVPVITSDASSLPEVVGETAVQVAPDDEAGWAQAIHHLLSHDEDRAEMIEAGFQQVKHFTWQRAATQLLKVYDHLL